MRGNLVDEQQTDQLAPAGWYAQPGSEAQPEVPEQLRWWNGTGWTDQYTSVAPQPETERPETTPAGVALPTDRPTGAEQPETGQPEAELSPYGPPETGQPDAALPRYAPTDAALPPADYPFGQPPVATPPAGLRSGTVSVWLLAFMPWLTLASVIVAFGFAIYAENPTWYWVATLLLPCLLTVGLALLDGRRLREWRHPRVPSWAWSLLGAPAYLIARAIVTRGQTRFGAAPMWVAMANIVASMLGAALAVVALASAVLYLISELSDAMSGIA